MFTKKSSQIIVGIVALFAILIVGFASLLTPYATEVEMGNTIRVSYGEDGNISEYTINDNILLDVSNCRSMPPQYAINILPLPLPLKEEYNSKSNAGVDGVQIQFVADTHTLSAPYYFMYQRDNKGMFDALEIPSSSITISDDSATIAFEHLALTSIVENQVNRVIIADSTGCFEKHFDRVQSKPATLEAKGVKADYGDGVGNAIQFTINGKQLDVSNCRSIPPQYAINILPLGEKSSGVQFVADKHTLSAPYYLTYESDKPFDFYGSEIPPSSITVSDDGATIAFQHPVPTENKVIRVIIADSTGCFEKHFD